MKTPPNTLPHWIVPTYHRMRAWSFAYAFLFCGLQAWQREASAWLWGGLLLQFLIYPHLVYWRALRAADTQRAELDNLLLDMALWGVWAAALEFPPWITFTLFITSAINNAISRGTRGLRQGLAAFAVGLLAGSAIFGVRFGPAESPWVAGLCAFGLTGYLMGIGRLSYKRTQSLRKVREKLKNSELALQQANDTLRTRLAEIELLQQSLEEQATRDPLTGLYNRRYLVSTLERELARCRRDRQPLSLLIFDIDHFKVINDRHGHLVGDQILRELGAMLARGCRREDVPCRFGGEEFVLVLPNMPATKALERGEQLRRECEQIRVPCAGGTVSTTVSIGVAVYPEHGADMDELTRRADLALYAVKHRGRNGIRIYDSSLELASA